MESVLRGSLNEILKLRAKRKGLRRKAEFVRHLILSRTNEGRVRAKARGVRFGRKPKLTKHQQAEALARTAQGETLTAIAK